MKQPNVTDVYQSRVDKFKLKLEELKKKKSRIALVRFLIVVATIVCTNLVWHTSIPVIIIVIVAGIAAFLYAVSVDLSNSQNIVNTEHLLQLCLDELDVIANNYTHRPDGKQYETPHHSYAQDLDIFGPSSLYQYVNRCTSEQGSKLLASQLLSPQTPGHITLQQEASKELSTKPDWCHQFLTYGITTPVTVGTEHKIMDWLSTKQVNFTQSYWKWIINIYTLITLSTIALVSLEVISFSVFSALALFFILISFSFIKKIHPTYVLLSRIVKEVTTLYNQLNWLEKESFTSSHLKDLQASVRNEEQNAAKEILSLKGILHRFDTRLNIYLYPFLNGFFLWDIRQMVSLNGWRKRNDPKVELWFKALASAEVSISIAALVRNNPEWCSPVIAQDHFVFEAKELGHPLIPAGKRIDNSFDLEGIAQIGLITGSNMGGKSTFLRSIGINTILALAGAPVCAKRFKISHVYLMSSMRIADNLAESTSTFYAELKKLQTIIEAVNAKRKVFILLDEILRGTNSLDRHTGSKALIKQLIQQQAVAVIATHDVELAQLASTYPDAIHNYHFDVQVANDELYFDYKLKDGICKSLNASILMKKIGIQI